MKIKKVELEIRPLSWDFIPLYQRCDKTEHCPNYIFMKFLFIAIEIEWD
jgi:hypothetical protein